jgi:hypothetical protein
VFVAAFWLQGICGPAAAQSTATAGSVRMDAIEIGLAGHFKVGEWTSARVEVTSSEAREARLAVRAPDPDDLWSRFSGPMVSLQPETPQRLEAVFRTGRLSGPVQLQVLDADNRVVASRLLRVEAGAGAKLHAAWRIDRPLHVVVGTAALAGASTSQAEGDQTTEQIGSVEIVRVKGLSQLPLDWRALQSASSVFLAGASARPGEASFLGDISEQSSSLLRDWVAMGGHLVLSIGSAAEDFRRSPLAAWVPIDVQGKTGFRQLVGLESFAGGSTPLRFSGAVTGAQLGPMSDKNLLAKEVNGPIVVRVPYGFGRVTLLAIDVDRAPLQTVQADARQHNRQLSQLGMTDLASQFQSAQEDFASIQRPSHWWVMGMILLYILVIGPLDYLIVHRWLRRPEWTWVTFPLLAAAAAGCAVWNSDRFNGSQVQCTQFDLIDFDTTTSRVRGRTWVSVYSPAAERFDVSVRPAITFPGAGTTAADAQSAPAAVLCWQGFPENTVGGVYRTGSVSLGRHGYEFDPVSGGVHGFPISKWSTKSLSASWEAATPTGIAESTLSSAGTGNLTGAIAHHLPFALDDCLLAVAGWAYLPTSRDATLEPHAEWQPTGPLARQRDLKALLTGARTRRLQKNKTESELLTTTETYDPQSHDQSRIVPMLTFHTVAGGEQYTGLHHAALRELELTNLRNSGRAVLIGRARPAVSNVDINGRRQEPAQQETYVRLVLPVNFILGATPGELMKPK